MIIHKLIQGSPEWKVYRAEHFNASDAPAMMGESPYQTRDQLMMKLKTGVEEEVSAGTQKRFDDGHRYEALARPIAENIIGEPLYPVVGSDGIYSASFDGITMAEDTCFEHKSLNNDLREFFAADGNGQNLPIMYRIQMEQQLMISGADRCLFMASKWNGDVLVEEKHCWYVPDVVLRQRIIDGWALIAKDKDDLTAPIIVENVEAQVIEALPVPSVVVSGAITTSNLPEITPKFDAYLSGINRNLVTDQEFADADANAKNCRETAKRIRALRENIIAQMSDVNAIDKELEAYEVAFNQMGLNLEKDVGDKKKAIKNAAILTAQSAFNNHIKTLEEETKPIRLNVPMPDFAGAIKSIRSIASMNSRINDALAKGKLQADEQARDIRAKLSWMRENTEGYKMLFSDIMIIINKPMDDLQLLVKSRITEHKTAEEEKAKKLQEEAAAAERLRIEQENSQKAQQEQQQSAHVETQSASNDESQPVEEVAPVVSQAEQPSAQVISGGTGGLSNAASFGGGRSSGGGSGKALRPARFDIIRKVAAAYNVTNTQAEQWLIEEFQIAKAA